MKSEILTCEGCAWYHEWFGVCCNGESEYRGDTPFERCELYETSEEMKEK